jgi:hypothetical protein
MPYTTYLANYTTRDIREVDMKAARGTTYWWHTDPVLFPFAYGLSYSSFTFDWKETPPASGLASPEAAALAGSASGPRVFALPADADAASLEVFTISHTGTLRTPLIHSSHTPLSHTVVVTNTGKRTADVVVTAFLAADPGGGSPSDTPLKKLFGFERFASVKPGEKRTAFFESDAR